MNRRSILTKTGKGLMEATGKTSNLSRDVRNILKEIDGKVSVSELMEKFGRMTEPMLLETLRNMEKEGYLREFVGKQDEAPRPSIPRAPTSPSSADSGEDLDFTAFTPAKPSAKTGEDSRLQAQAQDIARQAQATRAREEAAARARAEAAARARAEAEQRARLSTPASPKAEAQTRAQAEALDQARREAEERQRREAEEKARREAELRARIEADQASKRDAEERARREIYDKERRENEERARREAEVRAKREAEEKVRRDAEERVRREAEERSRKEIERRMREEREQAELKARVEAEARAKVEAEMRARRESEERARREEEERPRREEELRRRAEEEARGRREAEDRDALERSLREQEENARREAEYREREEQQRREEEERARLESDEEAQRAEEEEKRASEEKRAKEEEKRAREEEKAQAKAAKKIRKAARSKERAGEDAWRGDDEARDPNEAPLSAREIWAKRRPGSLAKQFAVMLLLTLIVAVAALPFVPLESGPYERSMQVWLGEPVKIGTVNLTLLPVPQLKFERVVIGKEHPMRAAVIKAAPVITSLLEDPISLKSLELENVTFPREFLPALLQDKGRRGSLGVQRIAAKGLKLDIPELNLPALEVNAILSSGGALQSVAIFNAERRLSVKLQPQGERAGIEISADTFPLPIGADLALSEFLAKGTVTKGELALSEVEARGYGGRLTGNMRLRWSNGWSMEGEFAVHQMEAGKIAAPLLAGGTLEGKGVYSMKGLLPERLILNRQLEGNFTIQKGSITNVDMTRLLQASGSGGGTTLFSEMSGNVSADSNRLLVRQIRMAAGLLNATGQVEMDPQKNLSGRIQIELRAESVQARAMLTVSGTLQNPQFRRSN